MNDIYIKYITKVPFNKKFDGFNNLISIPYVLLIFVFPIKYFLTGSVRHDPKITHGICRTLYCYKKKLLKLLFITQIEISLFRSVGLI